MSDAVDAVLFFDADCGLCARFACSPLTRAARVRPIGYQSIAGDAALARLARERGISEPDVTTAMVLVAGDTVVSGARAFNALLRRCGGWRAAAAAVLSLPFVLFVETLVYRGIAANRRRLSGWLRAPRCTPSQTSLNAPGGSPP